MNVLFITLLDIQDISNEGIYEDLLREFYGRGHNVYVISPSERRNGEDTHIIKHDNCYILKVKTGNIQKTNVIEKGIATVLFEFQYRNAIKKYYKDIKFDLVLYSTPPITIVGAVEYVKKRDNAKTYLLLKDIFPQNSVDLEMLSKTGLRGVLYNGFRKKEKRLYAVSDRIGCMSPANVDYVIRHNPEINPEKVEVCPNCIEAKEKTVTEAERREIRRKYGIPIDKLVFVYGGNLGKPQCIPFIIQCLKAQRKNKDVYFLIVGDGTEYSKIEKYVEESKQQNIKLMKALPKDNYDYVVASCDVGLIFLDHRFTTPNFPSRILSYMQAKIPVLAATDMSTDIGRIAQEGGFGWWCESNDVKAFSKKVQEMCAADRKSMGENGWKYLLENYTAKSAYRSIEKWI